MLPELRQVEDMNRKRKEKQLYAEKTNTEDSKSNQGTNIKDEYHSSAEEDEQED